MERALNGAAILIETFHIFLKNSNILLPEYKNSKTNKTTI